MSTAMEVKRHTAGEEIYKFLSKLSSIQTISIKMIKTSFRLGKLAAFCKHNYQRNQERRSSLLYIWETELANLMIKFRNSSEEEENK